MCAKECVCVCTRERERVCVYDGKSVCTREGVCVSVLDRERESLCILNFKKGDDKKEREADLIFANQ